MPAYQELDSTNPIEMAAFHPQVVVNNDFLPLRTATALTAIRRMDVFPGTALIRIDLSQFADAPITLNATRDDAGYQKMPTLGSRVYLVGDDGIDIWRGWITDRKDSGDQDSVVFEATEDQWLLSKVFVRGALVYDPLVKTVKYVESFAAETNPGGVWNCMYGNLRDEGVDDEYGLTPVFAPTAKRIMNYATPENTDTEPASWGAGAPPTGEYCAWTPRRFLLYLSALTKICFARTPNITGVKRSMSYIDGNFLRLDASDINGMWGLDPASVLNYGTEAHDPLDRKMQTVNFQGQAIAAALDATLRSVGTHQAYTYWNPAESNTRIGFAPIRWSATNQDRPAMNLECQRLGDISGAINRVVNFNLSESIHDYAEQVTVDGATIKIETSLGCNVSNGSGSTYTVDPATSLIVPAWTAEEELAWRQCVMGVISSTVDPTNARALYPPSFEAGVITDFTKFVPADGTVDPVTGLSRPSVMARGKDAVALASQYFPAVFRAFRINSYLLDTLGILDGVDDKYSDRTSYSALYYNRGILPNQLQYLIRELGEPSTSQANWICEPLPIRFSVQIGGKWHDLPYSGGQVQVSGDGLLWINSLGADLNWNSILTLDPANAGSVSDFMNVWPLQLRTFKINAAIPTEWRVSGTAERVNADTGSPSGDSTPPWGVSDKLREAFGSEGKIQAYFDAQNSFREHHQINSEPTASGRYVGAGDDQGGFPLNRILADGNESESAYRAAERKLRYLNAPRRTSTWTLPGIQTQVWPGQFIGSLVIKPDDFELAYPIMAPIGEVQFDFVGQKTVLGGLLSEATR